MSRAVSATFLQKVFAQETSEIFLCILQIDHDDLDTPIRIVNNTENITIGGYEYIGFPFQLSMPGDVEDQLPAVNISIDNVDRTIVEAVRTISSPPTVYLSVIMVSNTTPNTGSVERGPIELTLRQAEYDALIVSGNLEPHDILSEPFPQSCFTPNRYTALA